MPGSEHPAPDGFRFESLSKAHDRTHFACGKQAVDAWLQRGARQSQRKHLTVTKVLSDGTGIASFYSLAPGVVSLDQLPSGIARRLPARPIPILTLAWLGVDLAFAGRRLGTYTFLAALRHAQTSLHDMAGVGVVIDCLDADAARFYDRFGFDTVPGYPMKRVVSRRLLDELLATGG